MRTGYHFTSDKLRDGRPVPPVGEWLEHSGEIEPCQSGLHISEHPFDALNFAPGNQLHKVELKGDIQTHGDPVDKLVGRSRRIVATIDAERLLHEFAIWCALEVIDIWEDWAEENRDVIVSFINPVTFQIQFFFNFLMPFIFFQTTFSVRFVCEIF